MRIGYLSLSFISRLRNVFLLKGARFQLPLSSESLFSSICLSRKYTPIVVAHAPNAPDYGCHVN